MQQCLNIAKKCHLSRQAFLWSHIRMSKTVMALMFKYQNEVFWDEVTVYIQYASMVLKFLRTQGRQAPHDKFANVCRRSNCTYDASHS